MAEVHAPPPVSYVEGEDAASDVDGGADAPGPRKSAGGACAAGMCRPPAGAELSGRLVTAYGVGAYTFSIMLDLPSFYLQPFLLENVGLSAVAVGNLLLVTKVTWPPSTHTYTYTHAKTHTHTGTHCGRGCVCPAY
jgi:hypothetical protein